MTVEDIIARNRERWSETKKEVEGMTRDQIREADMESVVTMARRISDIHLMAKATMQDMREGDIVSIGDDLRSMFRTVEGALNDYSRFAALRTTITDWKTWNK
jgi:hypothetical protein